MKLERLVLSRNALTGPIPGELGNLQELTTLYLYGNQLTGAIPAELGGLSNLERLEVQQNQLSGGIPVEVGSLTELVSLQLNNNGLSGAIPASLGGPVAPRAPKARGQRVHGLYPRLSGRHQAERPELAEPAGLHDHDHLHADDLGDGQRPYQSPAGHVQLPERDERDGDSDPGRRRADHLLGRRLQRQRHSHDLRPHDDRQQDRQCHLRAHHAHTDGDGGGGGSVAHDGGATLYDGDEVTLTASWNDATHSFTGWGGDCEGTATTCALTIDAAKTVTAAFAALPATRCATTTATDCIRAVYLGAPGDYAQVQDIPADLLLTANSDGRYYVERGRQYTVVTAARLPTGWTRFYLDWSPLEFGQPRPVSASQLIKPVGTTYTFTVSEDEAAATLITFDLKQARPFVRPRPDGKPHIGDTVVSMQVQVTSFRYDIYDTTGQATADGSHALLMTEGTQTSAVTQHGDLVERVTGIIVNVKEGDGTAHVDFYRSIKTGDVVEWVPTGNEECWQRYRVTAIQPDPAGSPARKLFSLEPLSKFFLKCSGEIVPASGVLEVELRWNPPPTRPAADGTPTLLMNQPVTGPLTVRIAPFSLATIDIPAGMSIVRNTPYVMGSDGIHSTTVDDVKSGSRLAIDIRRGVEVHRDIVTVEDDTRDVGALFDQIAASLRLAQLGEDQ